MKLTDFKSTTNPKYLETVNYIISRQNCFQIECNNCPFCSENNAIDEKACWVNDRYREKYLPTYEKNLLLETKAKEFKILSKGAPTMKRINIKNLAIIKNNELKIEASGWNKYSLTLIVDNLNIKVEFTSKTITQANTILAPFGYELYFSTDWSKVEVGSRVRITSTNVTMGLARLSTTFKEYIQQTSQIIIFNGNKVEVYNESEVELCQN